MAGFVGVSKGSQHLYGCWQPRERATDPAMIALRVGLCG